MSGDPECFKTGFQGCLQARTAFFVPENGVIFLICHFKTDQTSNNED
jgi:hypothetical protein